MTWSLGAGKCGLQAAQEAEFCACWRWNSRVWGEEEPGVAVELPRCSASAEGRSEVWNTATGIWLLHQHRKSEIWECNCSRCNYLLAATGGLVSDAVQKGSACLLLNPFFFPTSISQPWLCWWTLVTVSVLCPSPWSGAAELRPTVPTALEIRKSCLKWDHAPWIQWTVLGGLINIIKAIIICCSWR